jgi:hypothetical protein
MARGKRVGRLRLGAIARETKAVILKLTGLRRYDCPSNERKPVAAPCHWRS